MTSGPAFCRSMDEGPDFYRHHLLAYHAWVGVRDIWMDYVKPVAFALILQVFSIVWLVGCAGWAIQVLWRL
jgi:succinate dehydrogenase hydrophobic membrane anchor protein